MFKTVVFLHLFLDLLTPVGKLSECMQGDSTNLLHAHAALEATLLTVKSVKSYAYSDRLQSLKKEGPVLGSAYVRCLVNMAAEQFFKMKPCRGEALNKDK